MTSNEHLAAELLATSASAYAAFAANQLLQRRPDLQQHFGETAFAHWKDHFRQRVMELSVAISEAEPLLFTSRVKWTRAAFQARQLPDEYLKESLNCLRGVLQEELPENSRQVPAEYLDAALELLNEPFEADAGLDDSDDQAQLAMKYLVTVLEGDSRQAMQLIVDAVHNGLAIQDAYVNVLLPAQQEIGNMWHRAEVSVAEEHLVTSTTARMMSVLYDKAEKQPPNGLTVVSAAVADNVHDIGIRAVSDFFEFAGWRAICLGGNAPPHVIVDGVTCFNASLLLLSAALSTQLPSVREAIQRVRELPNINCKIMVGGMAFADTPEIWRQLGADGFARSPAEAISIGNQLVQS